jgi:broad specificity phosphatase PhoE
MRLFVTRHGQTEWNSQNRVSGITDISLTDKGIEQAKKLSSHIIEYGIDMIITSPLIRAKITAEILSKATGKEIVVDSRLHEQNYGIFEGIQRDNEDFKFAKNQFAYKLLNGESLFQVAQRVYNLIDEIKEKYSNKNILLVTHGGICRVINSYFNDLTNDEYSKYYTRNCEIIEYHI